MKSQIFATALLGISLAAGCSDDTGPTGPAPSTFPQTIHATVGSASPICEGNDDTYGEVQYPCERFTIVVPRGGTLVARLTWPDPNARLLLGAGSRDFFNWDYFTRSFSGCEIRIPVNAGATPRLAIGLDTSRGGNTSQPFDVDVSLE